MTTADPSTAPSVVQEILPIDIALGTDDELLFVEGDLVFTTGVGATAQQCQLALLSFRGEWFANLESGTPWYEDVLGQKFVETRVRGMVRDALLAVDTVASIEDLEILFDGSTREVTISWTVLSTAGQAVAGETPIGVTIA